MSRAAAISPPRAIPAIKLAGALKILSRSEQLATGCWCWRGCLDGQGYGVVRIGRRVLWAHRAAYAAFRGGLPAGLEVHHTCHTRSCVNPAHLEAIAPHRNRARTARNGRV